MDAISKIKKDMDVHKKQSSKIEEIPPSLLKLNTSESWNFLYEGEHFEMDILGDIKILVENL
jgi:hypothetical protein